MRVRLFAGFANNGCAERVRMREKPILQASMNELNNKQIKAVE